MTWPPEGPMAMVLTQLLYIQFYKPDPSIQDHWNCPQFQELLQKIHQHIPDLETGEIVDTKDTADTSETNIPQERKNSSKTILNSDSSERRLSNTSTTLPERHLPASSSCCILLWIFIEKFTCEFYSRCSPYNISTKELDLCIKCCNQYDCLLKLLFSQGYSVYWYRSRNFDLDMHLYSYLQSCKGVPDLSDLHAHARVHTRLSTTPAPIIIILYTALEGQYHLL